MKYAMKKSDNNPPFRWEIFEQETGKTVAFVCTDRSAERIVDELNKQGYIEVWS